MPKQLIVDQIEVTQNGTIQIRMHKLSSDGDLIGNHRTAIEPGGDVDAQFAAVSAHMGQEGYAPVSVADIDKVKAQATAAWTPENVQAWSDAFVAQQEAERQRQLAAIAATQAAIDEANRLASLQPA